MSAKILKFPSKQPPQIFEIIGYTIYDEALDITYDMDFDSIDEAERYFEYYGIIIEG